MPIKFLHNVSVDDSVLYVDGENNRVGIGTTSPDRTLDVNGSVDIDGTLYINALHNHIRLIDADSTANFSVGVNTNFQIRDVDAATTPFTIEQNAPGNCFVIDSIGNVGIGKFDPTAKLHVNTGVDDGVNTVLISHTRNNSDVATQALKIDMNLSGADTTSGDRANSGIYIDLDSSADGDASDEHRIYGIWSDVRHTGFSDIVRSGYFRAENNNSTEKVAQLVGVYGQAEHDSNSVNGGVSSMMGVYGVSNIQDLGDVDNAYGGYFITIIPHNRGDADVGNTHGVYAEIQIDKATEITYGSMIGVSSIIDNNEDSTPVGNNTYLFKGDYLGTRFATNAWGIYVEGDKHYLEGNVGINETNPNTKLHVTTTSIVPATFEASTPGHLIDLVTTNSSPTYNGIRFYHGNTQKMSVSHIADGTTSGYVQIGNNWAAGSEILVVDGRTSRVGIGTTVPDNLLEIQTESGSGVTGNDGIFVKTPQPGVAPVIGYKQPFISIGTSDEAGATSTIYLGEDATATNQETKIEYDRDSDTLGIFAKGQGTYREHVRFGNPSSPDPRTYFSGDVGIGTTNPTKDFVVNSNTGGQIQTQYQGSDKLRMEADSGGGSFYSVSGAYTRFHTSGLERLRITSGGNVGIGTDSPAAMLEVAGNSILDKKSILRLPAMNMGSGGITDEYLVIARKYDGVNQNATGIIGKIIFSRGATSAGNNPSEYYINIQCAYNGDALNNLTYTGTEIFNSLDVIDISGTDYYALKVRTDGGGSSRFYAEGLLLDDGDSNMFTRVRSSDASVTVVSTGSMTPTAEVNGSGITNYVAKWSDADTITNSVIYDNGTNVGIGTTNPIQKLHVLGSGYINAGSLFIDSGQRLKWGNSNQWIEGTNDTSLEFSGGGGGTQMILTSDGSVGIGTTSPGNKLEVNSGETNVTAAFKSDDNQAWISVQDDDSGTYGALFGTDSDENHAIVLADSSANKRLVVSATTGNVGIGTTSPSEKLTIDGYARASYGNYLGYKNADVFDYIDSNTVHYWLKVGNIDSSNDGTKLSLEINTFGDNNYPRNTRFTVVAQKYGTGVSLSCFKNYGSSYSDILYVKLDSNLDLWVKRTISWDHRFLVKPIVIDGGAVFNYDYTGDNRTSTEPSGGTPIIQNDRAIRVATTDLSTVTHEYSNMYFRIDGDPKLTILNTGNIGIGTTSPGAKLEVNGDIISSGKIQLGSSADSDFFTGDSRMSVDGYIMTKAIVNTSETGSAPAAIVFGDGATFSNDQISLVTTGQRRLFVNTNGNITIQENLTVQGDISAANLGTASASAATDFVAVTGDTMTGTLDVHVNDTGTILKSGNSSAANTPDQFFLKHNLGNVEIGNSRGNLNITSGNVSITGNISAANLGTAASSAATDFVAVTGDTMTGSLTINGNSTYALAVDGAISTDQYIAFLADGVNSSPDMTIGVTSNVMTFSDVSGGGKAIFNVDNVGIGTTSPSSILSISSNAPVITAISTNNSSGLRYNVAGTAQTAHRFQYGGSTLMTIRDTGNVGIGTTDPSQKLEVAGKLLVDNGDLGSVAGDAIYHAEITGTRHHLDFKEVRTADGSDWSNTTYKLQMRVDATDHQSIDFVSDAGFNEHIDIFTGNQVFNTRFDANGNVGIGTTSPAEKLEVAGSVRVGNMKFEPSNAGRIGFNRNTTNGAIYNSNYAAFQINGPYSGADFFEIQSYSSSGAYQGSVSIKEGNVGIGTTDPAAKLHISSGTANEDCVVIIESDTDNNDETSNPRLELRQDGGLVIGRLGYRNNTNSLELINQYAEALYLGTSNSTDMTIESDGTIRANTGSFVVDTAGQGIYIGGTAAANKLDDYEEGTYTPSITATGTDTSGFSSIGYYTKIGDIVHVEMRITKFVDEEGSSKITNITLPFAANNTSTIYYKGGLWHSETYDKSNLYTLLRESTTNLTPYNGATNGLSLSADENNTIGVNITYKAQ